MPTVPQESAPGFPAREEGGVGVSDGSEGGLTAPRGRVIPLEGEGGVGVSDGMFFSREPRQTIQNHTTI